jgi:hypothetical protein
VLVQDLGPRRFAFAETLAEGQLQLIAPLPDGMKPLNGVWAADIKPEEVRWLWDGLIIQGGVTLMVPNEVPGTTTYDLVKEFSTANNPSGVWTYGYTPPVGGIDFGTSGDDPDYQDFAYFSFTFGMTFQTSDAVIQTRRIRRTALRHPLLAYVFGAVILAVAVNVIAGLIR